MKRIISKILLIFLFIAPIIIYVPANAQVIKSIIAQRHKVASSYDADAQAFLTATSITDPTISSAINTLVVAAKADGWWTLCYSIYPMVGGTSSTCAVNLKSPGTYNITWTGTITFDADGATGNGSTGYGDTGLNSSSVLDITSHHMSYWSLSDTYVNSSRDMGNRDDGVSAELDLAFSTHADNTSPRGQYHSADAYNLTNSISVAKGWLLGSRIAATNNTTNLRMYLNGTDLAAGVNAPDDAAVWANLNIYLMCYNYGGSPQQFSNRKCGFSTIGSGISSTIQSLMYTDIYNFMVACGKSI